MLNLYPTTSYPSTTAGVTVIVFPFTAAVLSAVVPSRRPLLVTVPTLTVKFAASIAALSTSVNSVILSVAAVISGVSLSSEILAYVVPTAVLRAFHASLTSVLFCEDSRSVFAALFALTNA